MDWTVPPINARQTPAGALTFVCGNAAAQQWPAKQYASLSRFPPGQAADIVARVVAERLTRDSGPTSDRGQSARRRQTCRL